jgi:CSLREA domain-containing protein
MRNTTLLLAAGIIALVFMSVLAGSPGTVEAATLVVDSTADANDDIPGDGLCATSGSQCTLRAAIEEANALGGDDAVTLPSGTYTLSLGSELAISSNLTLTGAGADITTIQAAATSGSAYARVINITGGTVTISGVTIRHGNLADHGAGIQNAGTLTVTDSTFSENHATNSRHGGAIKNNPGKSLTVSRSTFNGNSSSEGGAIQNRGTATITNRTFSNNSASSGGGLDTISGSSTVVNSTFTGNSAGSGGGIFEIFGSVSLVNTIVEGNTGSAAREDCFGSGITTLGNNLSGVGTGCPTCGPGDVTTADAKLGPLQDNGGPTFTHALLIDSPAPSTDQRGTSRPQGSSSDIGAFELVTGASVPGVTVWGLVALAVLMAAFSGRRLRRRASQKT